MFRNLKKKTKKFLIGKKFKNNFFSGSLNFIFALYALISPNLQIILKKNYTLKLISKWHTNQKNMKKIG